MQEIYQNFNNTLSDMVNPGAYSEKDEKSYEKTGSGGLVIQVSTATGSVPVENATVTISNTDGTEIKTLVTDKSGRTEKMLLPTIEASVSKTPGGELPYSRYNAKIEMDGYYTEEFLNIAIFDGIESIQPVFLEPLPEGANENDKIVINEKTEQI